MFELARAIGEAWEKPLSIRRRPRHLRQRQRATWQLRRAVASCLQRTEARGFADPLDAALLAEHELVDRGRAYRDIHRPATMGDKNLAAQRLKFDEFLRMQLALVARKRALAAEETGIVHAVDGELVPAFHAALPFPLTDDQAAAQARAGFLESILNAALADPARGGASTITELAGMVKQARENVASFTGGSVNDNQDLQAQLDQERERTRLAQESDRVSSQALKAFQGWAAPGGPGGPTIVSGRVRAAAICVSRMR